MSAVIAHRLRNFPPRPADFGVMRAGACEMREPPTSSVGQRLAAEFNLAFSRTRLPKSGSLDAWMTGQGVPAEVTDITAMAYAAAAVTTWSGAESRFDERPIGWYEPNLESKTRLILVPVGLIKSGPGQVWDWRQSFAGYDDLDDIVGFDPKRPNHWWRRIGNGVLLGEANLWEAQASGAPLKLFRDPLSWLRAGRAGVVIIDRAADPRNTLAGVPAIVCEDAEHERWLKRRFEAFALRGLPKIAVAA